MTDAPNTPAPKSGGSGLKKKVGPLPMWAWYALTGVVLGGGILFLRRGQGTATDTSAENPVTTGGINEDAYGAGYLSGAGSYEGALGESATGGTDVQALLDNASAERDAQFSAFQSTMDAFASMYGGGAFSEAKASPTNDVAEPTNFAAATAAAKKATATRVNTTNNARKGQTFTVQTGKNGNEVHVYNAGTKAEKRVEIKPAGKSTVTTAPKPTAAAKVNTTSNARAGQTYVTEKGKNGNTVHVYNKGKSNEKRVEIKPAAKKK